MPTLSLPAHATYPTLRAFWLAGSIGAGLSVGLVTALTRRDARYVAVAVPVAAVIAAPGLQDPERTTGPYMRWKQVAALAERAVTAWVTRVGYEAMLITRGIAPRADAPLVPQQRSGWMPRSAQPRESYGSLDTSAAFNGPRDPLRRLATGPGGAWVPALSPAVRLLRLLDTKGQVDERPPEDMYTLY